jgi:hypothetical protein
MEYEDFDLAIGLGIDRKYALSVLHSPAGNAARGTLIFPFSEEGLKSRLKDLQIALLRSGIRRRRIFSPEEEAVQDLGRALFDAIFVNEIRSCYDVSRREAGRQGKGLRLKLRIDEKIPELAVLPWEFLFDFREREYVCLSRNTPLVRYLETSHPPKPLLIEPPLQILGLIANPSDLDPLDIERERRRLEQAVAPLRTRGLVELTWIEGETWRALQRQMRNGSWHIFHFIGHSGFDAKIEEGLIVLSDEAGQAAQLKASQLGWLLADHFPLRMVVLNTCEGARGSEQDIFSSTAATLIRRGIPAVLAMQYEISDRAAIEFTQTFYEAIADGTPVDAAVADARKAIGLAVANSLEWGTPVLYMCTVDGRLFDLLGQKRAKQEPKSIDPEIQQKEVNPFVQEQPGIHIRLAMTLTGKQFKQIQEALLSGFNESTLRQMVKFHLDEDLDHIAGGGNLTDKIFNLVEWAKKQHRIQELIDAAVEANSNNSELQELQRAAKRWGLPMPVGEEEPEPFLTPSPQKTFKVIKPEDGEFITSSHFSIHGEGAIPTKDNRLEVRLVHIRTRTEKRISGEPDVNSDGTWLFDSVMLDKPGSYDLIIDAIFGGIKNVVHIRLNCRRDPPKLPVVKTVIVGVGLMSLYGVLFMLADIIRPTIVGWNHGIALMFVGFTYLVFGLVAWQVLKYFWRIWKP